MNLYEIANDRAEIARLAWEANKPLQSIGYSLSARVAYLAETTVKAVILPFAILRVTFATTLALLTWNWKGELFQSSYQFISGTSNHLFLSLFGAVISPALAHKYRDANITPFIIAARITIISGGLLYALLKR